MTDPTSDPTFIALVVGAIAGLCVLFWTLDIWIRDRRDRRDPRPSTRVQRPAGSVRPDSTRAWVDAAARAVPPPESRELRDLRHKLGVASSQIWALHKTKDRLAYAIRVRTAQLSDAVAALDAAQAEVERLKAARRPQLGAGREDWRDRRETYMVEDQYRSIDDFLEELGVAA